MRTLGIAMLVIPFMGFVAHTFWVDRGLAIKFWGVGILILTWTAAALFLITGAPKP